MYCIREYGYIVLYKVNLYSERCSCAICPLTSPIAMMHPERESCHREPEGVACNNALFMEPIYVHIRATLILT